MVNTLIELLEARGAQQADSIAFELGGETYTFGWLWDAVNGFAAQMQREGLAAGERVIVALPNSADFFAVFYGIQRAGGIPVPLYPDSGDQRIAGIAARCGAQRVVLPREHAPLEVDLQRTDSSARAVPSGPFPGVVPEDIAYIQYTSGSTGQPKGVPIRHHSMLTNVRQMIAGMEVTADDVFVSWVPVYHDMGLVIMTLMPFYIGARLVLLPTSFVNLRQWLLTIAEVRGTFTASPDFGYRLAMRYAVRPEEIDLTSLRVALNAAELARPETIRSFESLFGLQNVMTIGYGLAEATVGVSMTRPGKPVRTNAAGVASVGPPFPGVEIEILGADSQFAAPGEIGEILVRSPANTSGYFEDPEASAALFWQEGFIHTGDIGSLEADGELFVVGRMKEMLKHAGQTLAPIEVEAAVEGHPSLRAAAAVSADLGGIAGEQIILFCELRKPGKLGQEDLHALAVDLVARVRAHLGFRPGRLYLVKPRTIPLTANGKVQRSLLRERFSNGQLQDEGLVIYPNY